MKRFVALYESLDASTSTLEKVGAMVAYFRDAPARDAGWAAWILCGGRIKRSVGHKELREALARATNLPAWMIEECYGAVGDLSETIALLVRGSDMSTQEGGLSLAEVLEGMVVPMRSMTGPERVRALEEAWKQLPTSHRFVFQKLMSGTFRVGVSRTLAVRALAQVAGVEQAEMSHRVMGDWKPTSRGFEELMSPADSRASQLRPYPFYLASPLECGIAAMADVLGDVRLWQAEWKWDGIRAQVIRRAGRTVIWSRGEEVITDRFPELRAAMDSLPEGSVVDGEILAWDYAADVPLAFGELQRRIGRTSQVRTEELLFVDTPVRLVAYDLLEVDGEDVRSRAMSERRGALDALIAKVLRGERAVTTSERIEAANWAELAALRQSARARGVEGLMLKRLDSPYGTGRQRGAWWKWKVNPFTIDAVLTAAQPGSGRRASVFTDYTFGVWSGDEPGQGELVTIAKAYSGLTDAEIDRVDAFVRRATTARHGPVRSVSPTMVFELAFEGLQASSRHKAGIALRFPRISRMREDKRADQADTIASVRRAASAGEARL